MPRKDGQNRTDWTPSIKQMEIVELLINPDDKRSKTDKIKDTGVSRSTFYEWMKSPNFVAYMNSQIDRYTDGEVSEVWKALIRNCKMGKEASIKLFFEMKGMYAEKKKLELAGNDGGPMELAISIDYGDGDIAKGGAD